MAVGVGVLVDVGVIVAAQAGGKVRVEVSFLKDFMLASLICSNGGFPHEFIKIGMKKRAKILLRSFWPVAISLSFPLFLLDLSISIATPISISDLFYDINPSLQEIDNPVTIL